MHRIGLDDLSAFIVAAKDIVKKTPTAFPLQGLFMRLSGKSDIYMSTAYQRDTVHVEFALWKRTNGYEEASGSLAGYQTIIQIMVNEKKLFREFLNLKKNLISCCVDEEIFRTFPLG